MLANTKPDSSWSDCASGQLKQFAEGDLKKRTTRTVVRIGAVTASLVLTLGLSFQILQLMTAAPREANYGGITCTQFKNQVVAYHIGTLDAETRAKMDLHRKRCLMCNRILEAQQTAKDSKPSSVSLALFGALGLAPKLQEFPD
jgi:hypothetical protein